MCLNNMESSQLLSGPFFAEHARDEEFSCYAVFLSEQRDSAHSFRYSSSLLVIRQKSIGMRYELTIDWIVRLRIGGRN